MIIRMIKLRILRKVERIGPVNIGSENAGYYKEVNHDTLQFRTGTEHSSIDGNVKRTHIRFSEWEDVPIVEVEG